MKDKLNQFILNLQGQFVEVSDASNKFQCMDLAYAWVFTLGYPKATIQRLYAYEVYTKPNDLTLKYFDLIPNTPEFIPQDGDIGVVDKTPDNIAGHIFICLGGGTTSKFNRFEQNLPLGNRAAVHEGGYAKFLGVLRPKVFDTVPPDQAQLDEAKATIKAFTDFRQTLAQKLATDDQTTSIIGAVERFLVLEDQNRSLQSKYDESEKAKETLEKENEALEIATEELKSKLRAFKGLEEAYEEQEDELALLRERKVIDRFTTGELFGEMVRRLLRKK